MKNNQERIRMKIAVIGAGAIGSVVAAHLTKAGQDVLLVGRQDQVEAIQSGGLKITGVRGDETVQVNAATALNGQCDLVIFTVKTQDLESAIRENREYLMGTPILSSQNGVQSDHILQKHFPESMLYSSIVMFGSTYIKPGEVTFNFEGDWIIGKPFEQNDSGLVTIVEALKPAFSAVISDDILGMKWLKLFVNFNNCIPAVLGQSMQETFADIDMCRLSILLLREGMAIIQKAGINLVSLPNFPVDRIVGLANMPVDQAAGIINKTLTTLSKEPLYGSILQSIVRGRESEIDYINGEVVRLAKTQSMDAPLNQQIVEMVKAVEPHQKYYDFDYVKQVFKLNQPVQR